MIEVELDGYKYYYQKTDGIGRWFGSHGYEGSLSRLAHCAVPTSMWSKLRGKALADGHEFLEEIEAPKKKVSKRKTKAKKNSISIF